MDFLKELQKRINAIDNRNGLTLQQFSKPKSTAQFYSLVKIFNGQRTRVGFGLTEDDAKMLANVLVRKMQRCPHKDESGNPMFEITLSEIIKEN